MKLPKSLNNLFLLSILSLFFIAAVANSSFAGSKKGGYLGVFLEKVDDELREAIDYKGEGAYVEDVVEDSPADKAGMKAGDIIIEYEGNKIEDSEQLRKLIRKSSSGDKVKLVVVRDGKNKKLKAELAERKKFDKELFIVSPGAKKIKKIYKHGGNIIIDGMDNRGFLGVKLQSMSEQLAEYFGVKGGALVGDVVKDSPAEKAGIKAGDVLTEFDGRRVEDDDDLRYFIGKTVPGDEVVIAANRKGTEKKFTVKLGECPQGCKIIRCGDFHDGDIDIDFDIEDIEEHLKDLPLDIEHFEEDGEHRIKIKVQTSDEG